MMPPRPMLLLTAGPIQTRDPEPWGKAFSYSLFFHGAAVMLMLLLSMSEKKAVQTILREVTFIEKPVVTAAPEQAVSEGSGGKGTRVGEGSVGSGFQGKVERAASHPEMANVVPLSSPAGSAKGQVVTGVPMSGPIVSMGELGMVGVKKGGLRPLAGRTVGTAGGNPESLPTGVVELKGTGPVIALAKEEVAAIQKKESSLGVPLISRQVVGNSLEGKVRQLAANALGEPRKVTPELLKANPLDSEKWGKRQGPFSMEGPLKYRKILKMELPPYPRWAEEQGIEATVSFRLWVDAKGKVKDNFYLEKTSGYSELDYLAKESLRRFNFVAIPSDQPQEDEWGVATFRFELKK
jgi:TonB family protein